MRSIKKLRHKLDFMRDDAVRLMEQEKRDKERYAVLRAAHYKSYQVAIDAHHNAPRKHEARIQSYLAECNRIRQNHSKQSTVLQRFVDRIRRDIESAFEFDASVLTVSWRVLPPGEWTLETILQHYVSLQRTYPEIMYDVERIRSIFSIRPSSCYIGTGEFDGYIVFAFPQTSKVVLECPVYGNAIYVIDSDWQSLSRLTKSELLMKHADSTTRIIHSGDWFQRLNYQLR